VDNKEWENLRFQIGTAKKVEKTRFNPYALLYIEKNDKRVNEIIIALSNLIEQPPKTKKIGFI